MKMKGNMISSRCHLDTLSSLTHIVMLIPGN